MQFKYCPKCGSNQFIINNEKSKNCKVCGFSYYYNAAAATVAVILNSKKQLLVCRRAKNPCKGMLDLPGGFIDADETGEEGVKREVKEETSLTVHEAKYLFSLPNKYLYSDFLVQTLDLFFLCKLDPSSEKPIGRDDVSESFYADIDSLEIEDFGLDSIKRGLTILKNSAILELFHC